MRPYRVYLFISGAFGLSPALLLYGRAIRHGVVEPSLEGPDNPENK